MSNLTNSLFYDFGLFFKIYFTTRCGNQNMIEYKSFEILVLNLKFYTVFEAYMWNKLKHLDTS